MSCVEISVVLTTFNQPIEKIYFSLRSILAQEEVDFEIIIADDCSLHDQTQEIENFFLTNSFRRYKIVRSPKNVKTVLNILNGLHSASGKYVKTLGAGDALYSSDTLRSIVDFMERNKLRAGFGTYVAFWPNSDGAYASKLFQAPNNIDSFLLSSDVDNEELLAHQLLSADWIPGGAQFFETSLLKELLNVLASECGVLYCEDFAATLMLASQEAIVYFGKPVVWYEWGEGVSTGRNKSSADRLYSDHARMYLFLSENKPYGSRLIIPRFLFNVRKAVSRSRLYFTLRDFLAKKRYLSGSMRSGKCNTPNEFFYACLACSDGDLH